MRIVKTLLLFSLIFISKSAAAQDIPWKSIEDSIKKNTFLQDQQIKLLSIKANAIRENNAIIFTRASFLLMQIADKRSEDSLFFKNSTWIDSVLNSKESSAELRAITHLLKAKRLITYRRNWINNPKRLLILEPPAIGYSTMKREKLDSIIQNEFDEAIAGAAFFDNKNIQDLIWLSSQPFIFLFKPDFRDISFYEKFLFSDNAEKTYLVSSYKNWCTVSPDIFFNKDYGDGQKPTGYNVLKKWALSGIKKTEKFYFIESLARKYYLSNYSNSETLPCYIDYLKTQLQSPYASVKANSLLQLCNIFTEQAKSYTSDYQYYFANSNNRIVNFDSTFRFRYTELSDLLRQHKHVLDSFNFLKIQVENIEAVFLQKQYRVDIDDNIIRPNDSLKLLINFRNINRLYFRVVRVNAMDDTSRLNAADPTKVIWSSDLQLPSTQDFQRHSIVTNLQPSLPIGTYVLMVSDDALDFSKKHASVIKFTISNIAVIDHQPDIFVLDRSSGKPIPNAQVIIQSERYQQPLQFIKAKKTDQNGHIAITETSLKRIFAINGIDTVLTDQEPIYYYNRNEKEITDNDDLEDFLEENTKVSFFTDRSIYRPGQTVHFKGILLTKDLKTGEKVLLSKKKSPPKLFKSLYYDDDTKSSSKNFPPMIVYLNDANDKTVDSLSLTINDYGSFAGSFVINKEAATGGWTLETDIENDHNNNGEFSVEEYKRPNFEANITLPKNIVFIDDSIEVKVKVRSFANAMLANVKIKYEVEAQSRLRLKDSSSIEQYVMLNIIDTTGFTDKNGELSIKIKPDFLKKYVTDKNKEQSVIYSINVEATDETGETHEASSQLTAKTRPVNIYAPFKQQYRNNAPVSVKISTKNDLAGDLKKDVVVKVYRIEDDKRDEELSSNATDFTKLHGQWIYKIIDLNTPKDAPAKFPIVDTTTSGDLIIPQSKLEAGKYLVEIVCKENGLILGKTEKYFSVYDIERDRFVKQREPFQAMTVNTGVPGENISWITGNKKNGTFAIYLLEYVAQAKKRKILKQRWCYQNSDRRIDSLIIKIPADALPGQMSLSKISVVDNNLFRTENHIYVTEKQISAPEIIFEQYRKKLIPGSAEKFVVSVKTNNVNTAAELLTTIYDATLDQLEKHNWEVPQSERSDYFYNQWSRTINDNSSAEKIIPNKIPDDRNLLQPIWWQPSSDGLYVNGYFTSQNEMFVSGNMLQGRVSGLSLSEVVTVGYGQKINIRGTAGFNASSKPLYVIDGVLVSENDIAYIDMTTIRDMVVLKGYDATSIYGSRAADGVIILSRTGKINMPTPEEPVIKIRKNFSETAFFKPQLLAGKDGFYTMEFTMPESVTEWNWKLLAHTKKAKFIYAERKLVSQLSMMVQPNMPRFLFEGDNIILKTRISNLDSIDLSGSTSYKIEDAVTGEDITEKILRSSATNFTVPRSSNTMAKCSISIPEGFSHPITIRIIARAGNFSDGEEYTIPIQNRKIMVAKSVPFTLANVQDSIINKPLLPVDAKPLGIGLYINPKPQAAIINALPYLAFYEYDCAEQTFNKMLANIVAIQLIKKDTTLTKLAGTAKAKSVTPNALPEELSEATMPWLQLQHKVSNQQNDLAKVLDTIAAKERISKHLQDLWQLQNSDGGFAWFAGGNSNEYISTYLMASFGKWQKEIFSFFPEEKQEIFVKKISSLIDYCDKSFMDNKTDFPSPLQYIDARSYWKINPVSSRSNNKIDSLLETEWKQIDRQSLSRQALMIKISLKYNNKKFSDRALRQLESIKQLAVSDHVNGVRWKDISNQDDFSASDEETITTLAETFRSTGNSQEMVDGIIKWLLQSKQEHYWRNTKSTAAVLGLLYSNENTPTTSPVKLSASINNENVVVTDDLLSGSPVSFTPTNELPNEVKVVKDKQDIIGGGLNYYYLSATPVTASNDDISIVKKIFRFNKTNDQWEPVEAGTTLHIAEKIKTELTINTKKMLRYVFIDERRAAAFEPTENTSGYRWTTGLSYYESIRDFGQQFFAERISSGTSVISYETIVAKEGSFYTGNVSLQCMYAPGVKAYGNGERFVVKE